MCLHALDITPQTHFPTLEDAEKEWMDAEWYV